MRPRGPQRVRSSSSPARCHRRKWLRIVRSETPVSAARRTWLTIASPSALQYSERARNESRAPLFSPAARARASQPRFAALGCTGARSPRVSGSCVRSVGGLLSICPARAVGAPFKEPAARLLFGGRGSDRWGVSPTDAGASTWGFVERASSAFRRPGGGVLAQLLRPRRFRFERAAGEAERPQNVGAWRALGELVRHAHGRAVDG